MPNIPAITNSLVSAVNENTLALASLKFDFSLVKVDAPSEYLGLGEALSTPRRVEAEGGSHHQTARRLGALFEQLVPSTPHLIKAYGLRSTEIIQARNINPTGSRRDGPFEDYVGADMTAMWAAATSGISSLGVYLLACLLARAWDSREAVSLWVELVDNRRKEIMQSSQNHENISDSSRMSVFQEISRRDLARLDASARAWLQSADSVKLRQLTQFTLIVKNVQLPFSGRQSTYAEVMHSWQQAMIGIEHLIAGQAQEISNRAVLLAFSAWHIFPDLIVLGREIPKVVFQDHCVNPQGVGTIAIQPELNFSDRDVTWSLALSHLRYYGDPIVAKSDGDFSRVTIQQLHIIALGSILNHWEINQRDTEDTCQWFLDLWKHILKSPRENSEPFEPKGFDWFQYLVGAARTLLCQNTVLKREAHQLLAYGRRRAKNFLSEDTKPLRFFLGLRNSCILAGLADRNEPNRGVEYLRALAHENGFRASEALIGHFSQMNECGAKVRTQEFLTAVPHTCASKKRDELGNPTVQSCHARWIYAQVEDSKRAFTREEWQCLNLITKKRVESIQNGGEKASRVFEAPLTGCEKVWMGSEMVWTWQRPPLLYDSYGQNLITSDQKPEHDNDRCPSLDDFMQKCTCLEYRGSDSRIDESPFVFRCFAKVGNCVLFRKYKGFNQREEERRDTDDKLSPSASSHFIGSKVRPQDLVQYLQSTLGCELKSYNIREISDQLFKTFYLWSNILDDFDYNFANSQYLKDLARQTPNHESQASSRLSSLEALAVVSRIYDRLEGAMISLKVVDQSLGKTLPLQLPPIKRSQYPHIESQPGPAETQLSPSEIFSCIVYLESGTIILEPDVFAKTIAIASGNSLFVLGKLLSDPCDNTQRHLIKRIAGNIGRPGICLMVAPIEPKIRPLTNQYNLVEHTPYDNQRENNFKSTSLHLSFTEWTMPITSGQNGVGIIDQEIFLVESVVSVRDAGKWVADLDVLRINFTDLSIFGTKVQCLGHTNTDTFYDYTAIDSWEELLDRPNGIGIFRAHGNWAARLAAVSILFQKEQGHTVRLCSPDPFCLRCFDRHGIAVLPQRGSPHLSICID